MKAIPVITRDLVPAPALRSFEVKGISSRPGYIASLEPVNVCVCVGDRGNPAWLSGQGGGPLQKRDMGSRADDSVPEATPPSLTPGWGPAHGRSSGVP